MARSKDPTPEQLARFGHIASAIREAMGRKGWRTVDLSHAMGLNRGSTTPYTWLGARGAPTGKYLAKLSTALGIPKSELVPREAETMPITRRRASRVETGFSRLKADVLSFAVHTDGTATIALRATLPVDAAISLLKQLLDAGLSVQTAEHGAAS